MKNFFVSRRNITMAERLLMLELCTVRRTINRAVFFICGTMPASHGSEVDLVSCQPGCPDLHHPIIRTQNATSGLYNPNISVLSQLVDIPGLLPTSSGPQPSSQSSNLQLKKIPPPPGLIHSFHLIHNFHLTSPHSSLKVSRCWQPRFSEHALPSFSLSESDPSQVKKLHPCYRHLLYFIGG